MPSDRPAHGRPGADHRHVVGRLGGGADPKVVQRILGHAPAVMTMDLDGHLIVQNLWDSATRLGGVLGASEPDDGQPDSATEGGAGA